MFDKLNDDCWLTIAGYLEFGDQLALSRVSERLRGAVHAHWRHLKEAHLSRAVVWRFEQEPTEMHDFLRLASGSLQSVVLEMENCPTLLESWKAYSFPKMISFNGLWHMANCEESDKVTLRLTQLFPQLVKLTLQSSTTGQHLCCWPQLQELHLFCCENLDGSLLEQIFKTLPLRKLTLLFYGYNISLGDGILAAAKCATLEELLIDDHHLLGGFLPNLLQLPRLRRLTFYTRDYYEALIRSVGYLHPLRVQALIFNDTLWSSFHVSEAIVRMSNLRRLALQEDDMETKRLYRICAKLPQLEELHLMKMRELPTPTQLWDMVGACGTLKLLNLSKSKLHEQFLELSATCLDRVLKKRAPSAPQLTLHVDGTILQQEPEKTIAALKHPNLKVSFKPFQLNVLASRFVEIEFYPLTD